MREVAAEFRNPVLMYSIGKDSSVMLHLARKAFYPSSRPSAAAHRHELEVSRDDSVPRRDSARARLDLIVHTNQEGMARGINPIASGSALHTEIMKTEALKQALDKYGFDAAIGGARRDEEKSRAKERMFSLPQPRARLGPQAAAAGALARSTTRGSAPGKTMRVFPLSNWTELDVWEYIAVEEIPVVPLYFAKPRPVVDRDGV